jgi:hypothetical protein
MIKFWLVIKDDSKRTFEVCGQAATDNAFTNKVVGMQRAGMEVSAVVLPITNRTSSKEVVTFTNYKREDGLWERLQENYRKILRRDIGEWEE